ncbi:MAG: sensor histidine kinase [Kangiellaceae bacterium]|nr:sensor histidine kinase [Kangiellaceae bacterium]
MIKLLKKVDAKLLPRLEYMPLGPYIWLIYLSIFFVSLWFDRPIENSQFYAAIGTIAFLVVYFHGYWASSKVVAWNIVAILVIGTLMAELTQGASVFFVYAGAFCCRLGYTRKAVIGLVLIATWIGLLSLIMNYGPFFYVPAALFSFMIGGINIYQHDIAVKKKEVKLTQQEVRRLARTSERERIARDLHDLIGHTFSVITLKAELANKLIDKDLNKAKQEIKALEEISRDALSQVREVVTGYRTSDLNTELAHAKYVLESNEINFNYQFDQSEPSQPASEQTKLDDTCNKELAIILKELVTNILKHSQATRVEAHISNQDNQLTMRVSDDGVGIRKTQFDSENQGYGLKGIEERVAKLNGKLSIESSKGTEIMIIIPFKEHA